MKGKQQSNIHKMFRKDKVNGPRGIPRKKWRMQVEEGTTKIGLSQEDA